LLSAAAASAQRSTHTKSFIEAISRAKLCTLKISAHPTIRSEQKTGVFSARPAIHADKRLQSDCGHGGGGLRPRRARSSRCTTYPALAYICAMCPAAQQSPDPRSSIEPSREGAGPRSYTARLEAPAS
jgi:hypothetical protein